jgi:hypothetical protein
MQKVAGQAPGPKAASTEVASIVGAFGLNRSELHTRPGLAEGGYAQHTCVPAGTSSVGMAAAVLV